MPRSNMRLSDNLKASVKAAAAARNISIADYVHDAIARYGRTAEPTDDFGDARLHFKGARYESIMGAAGAIARERWGSDGRKRIPVIRAALVEATRRDGQP